MIDLFRRDGRPLVVGHRGAAAVSRENTLEAFRAAVDAGVDLVEFDVVAMEGGPLVVAHSHRLGEITDGARDGSFAGWSLAQLRAAAPHVPTLDEALAWFAVEAPATGIHVDLKLHTRLDEVARLLEDHGVSSRTVVTSVDGDALREVTRASTGIRAGLTYPDDRLGVSRRRYRWPVARVTLAALRAALPPRLPAMVRRSGASALMLQHRLVSAAVVRSAHECGVPVHAWTVDDHADISRVLEAGVDGVITNDPARLLATLPP
jgi:glycerophosphoryl diester phosphodiesterase